MRWTIILFHDGGTYVSQVQGETKEEAIINWSSNFCELTDNIFSLEDQKSLIEVLEEEGSQIVEYIGLVNAYTTLFYLREEDEDLSELIIIKTV